MLKLTARKYVKNRYYIVLYKKVFHINGISPPKKPMKREMCESGKGKAFFAGRKHAKE